MKKLYVIGTPIGNLTEFNTRAIEVIKTLDYLLAEDTRVTVKLLNHYSLKVPLKAYHQHNYLKMNKQIITDLNNGLKIGLVSDAGMPLISDPGQELIKKINELEMETEIISGPSAFVNAFVKSGFSAPFAFYGFLNLHKQKDQQKAYELISKLETTTIFYLASHDLKKLEQFVKNNNLTNEMAIVKELTKINEKIYFFKQANHFQLDMINQKGEFVVLFKPLKQLEVIEELTIEAIENLNKLNSKQLIMKILELQGYRKNQIKKMVMELKNEH